jgi:hypothetical protein
MSIILSLVGSRISDDSLTREGYRQVVRISGKDLVKIFGTRILSWMRFRGRHTPPTRSVTLTANVALVLLTLVVLLYLLRVATWYE